VGCTRGESREVSRERTRYGYTQIRSGGRSWSDASRALPARGPQGLLVELRALARRKLEVAPDAGHEQRKGERVRGNALTIISTRGFGLWVSARRLSIRRKAFSGSRPPGPHGHGEVKSFGSQGNPSGTIREERVTESASDGTEAGRACLRVTTRTSDGRHGSVKASRGPRRAEGSPHPRR
jgi:hypothetical protein